jgi:hypothetical protein
MAPSERLGRDAM